MGYSIKNLRLDDPYATKDWDNFVTKNDDGHHHKTAFLKVISSAFDHTNMSVYAVDENTQEVVGVLPLVYINSKVFGKTLTSLPFFNYGGCLTNNDEYVEFLLLEAAKNRFESTGAKNLQLRFSKELPTASSESMQLETHKANMVLTLPEEVKMVGAGNAKKRAKLRSQAQLAVRKAEENSVFIEQKFGREELLNDYYAVFSEHMRDLGTPVYGKVLFQTMLKQFPEDSILTVLYWDGKPVSCGFLLKSGKRMSIPWASSLNSHNFASMNTHMYWNILDYAIKQGMETFDFGRSTIDAGTYKFKAQWGAQPQPCYWYMYSNAEKTAKNPTADDSKFQLAIEVWKRLPLAIANFIGPSIVKDIP